MSERLSDQEPKGHEQIDQRAVEQAEAAIEKRHERHEVLNDNPEKTAEKQERSKVEALQEAAAAEKQQDALEQARHEQIPDTGHIVTNHERHESYNATMQTVRQQMTPAKRVFSKAIHNRAVEATSEVVGKTIARPAAILSGSIAAFIITLAVYMIARYFGYPLSGSETIIAFAGGWLIGLLYDYFRVMITGKKDL